jgi:hypothetical protein
MIARSALLSLTLILAGTVASAQDAPASAPPSPEPAGFSGRAHITLRIPSQGSTVTAGAGVAVSQREQLTRIDLLSVDASALPIRIPPLTCVIDRRANTITVWNDAAHLYHTQSFLPAAFGGSGRPTPAPDASPRQSRAERSMLADLDVLTFNLRLTGHARTAGIASTGLAFDAKARQRGKTAIVHLSGTMQIANDSALFPVAFQAQVSVNSLAPSRVSYLVDAFERHPPPPETFVVPSGYREAATFGEVLSGIPQHAPAPAPSETASASPTASP